MSTSFVRGGCALTEAGVLMELPDTAVAGLRTMPHIFWSSQLSKGNLLARIGVA